MYYDTDGQLAGISMYPRGVSWPGGTWPDHWSPGHTNYNSAAEPFTSPNFYKDPYLGGIFGDIWGGIKTVAGGVVKVGTSVVRAVPAAAVGMVSGGIPGAIAAGGATAVKNFLAKPPEQQEQIRQTYAAMELENRVPAYQQQYPDSISSAANRVYMDARQQILGRAGEYIARTPEGRAAITSTVRTDIMSALKPALPVLLIGGALFMFTKVK